MGEGLGSWFYGFMALKGEREKIFGCSLVGSVWWRERKKEKGKRKKKRFLFL